MSDKNLQLKTKSLADRSKDILLGYPLANWSDNLRQLHADMLEHIEEIELVRAAISQQSVPKKYEPSQAMRAALAQSQKDGTSAFICEGEAVFVSREGSPELQDYPECPMCHGSGCAGDVELSEYAKSHQPPSCEPDIFAWACWPDGMPMEKRTASLCEYDPKAYKRKIPLYAALPDYEALRAENERLKEREQWIYDKATTSGGGHGFNVSFFVPVDHEDIFCGIDAAIKLEQKLKQ